MSTVFQAREDAFGAVRHSTNERDIAPRFVATTASSRIDAGWAPPHAKVGIVSDSHEAQLVHELRYRVYVNEMGTPPLGVDFERGVVTGELDARSCLWYARDDQGSVGTITQTIMGPDFDRSLLPTPALQLDAFEHSVTGPIGFSSRFVILADRRSMWVLPSLARYTYAHGRRLGAKFDFMVTSPTLVPLFERLGYVRYTATAFHLANFGVHIPMVLPATDYQHLESVRSACLAAAAHFQPEPEWGAWLRATHPMIDVYYNADPGYKQRGAALVERTGLPMSVAIELCAMSFVHHFPAGISLRKEGDRVTCTYIALTGQLSVKRNRDTDETEVAHAPDGVAFSQVEIVCETAAQVLSVPDSAITRLMRRYPQHSAHLQELMESASRMTVRDAQLRT